MLIDQSVMLIDGAVETLEEAHTDWTSKRCDASSDFYLLEEDLDEHLPLPCSHLPTNKGRALSDTCGASGCDKPRNMGKTHTTEPGCM